MLLDGSWMTLLNPRCLNQFKWILKSGVWKHYRCVRRTWNLTLGYSKTLIKDLESAFQRLEQGRDLRERFRQIEGKPELDHAKWFGVQQDLGGSERDRLHFHFTADKDELTALDAELTQYESDFVQ